MATAADNQRFSDDMFGNYPLDRAIDFIKSNFEPADIFGDQELSEWAENNGYVKSYE